MINKLWHKIFGAKKKERTTIDFGRYVYKPVTNRAVEIVLAALV